MGANVFSVSRAPNKTFQVPLVPNFLGRIRNIPILSRLESVLPQAVRVSLSESFAHKLGSTEATNESAVRVLNEIKRESSLYSWMAKPLVCFSTSAALTAVGVVMPGGWFLMFPRLLVAAAGTLGFAASAIGYHNGDLARLSQAYQDLSTEAKNAVTEIQERLEGNKNVELEFTVPLGGGSQK